MKLSLLVHIDVKCLKELIRDARPVNEIPEGLSSDRKTTRNGNAYTDHLAEACAFAADNGQVFLADILQPYNSFH